MNKLLEVFNKVLSGFEKKPISILAVGTGNLEIIGYLIEYVANFGGRLMVADTNVDNLKTAKTIYQSFLGKIDLNFYLGSVKNFLSPEWNFVYLDADKEEFDEVLYKSLKSVVLFNTQFFDGPVTAHFPEVNLGLLIPNLNPQPKTITANDKYQEYFQSVKADRDFVFEEVLNGFNKNPLRILEIGTTRRTEIEGKNTVKEGDGCSTLFWINYIKQNGGSLVCVDISRNAIEACRQITNESRKGLDVQFYVGDGKDYIDQSFDLIYLDGGDSPIECLEQFQKISPNTKVLVDDAHVKGIFLSKKYNNYKLYQVNVGHQMIYYPESNRGPEMPVDFTPYYVNNVNESKTVMVNTINNENICVVVFHGGNRNPEILDYHKKVMTHLGIRVNYVYYPFAEHNISHGMAIDDWVKQTEQFVDYWVFLDNDAIPLQKNYLEFVLSKISDKNTLYGIIGQSNHLKGPNGDINHPYIYGSGMAISKVLWQKLGRPSFNEDNVHCDTAERITYLCEQKGYNIFQLWPKSVQGLTNEQCEIAKIDRKHAKSAVGHFHFGFGTVYGQDLFYHQMCANVPGHKEEFIKKCKEVLGE